MVGQEGALQRLIFTRFFAMLSLVSQVAGNTNRHLSSGRALEPEPVEPAPVPTGQGPVARVFPLLLLPTQKALRQLTRSGAACVLLGGH